MVNVKKQLKITKLLRKGGATQKSEDTDDIEEEIKQLKSKLTEKQNDLFQVLRNQYKRKAVPRTVETEKFVRPQKIIASNSVETLKRSLKLNGLLTGMEVQSYIVDDYCCIVYHMQHDSQNEIDHGLRIEMNAGNHEVSKSSMPLGFNLKAVIDGYKNVMIPECLCAVRKALVAYYDRLEQYEKLRSLLNIDANMFRLLDSSHIDISFHVQSVREEEDEIIKVSLKLDYRIYDIRPKVYSFKESDLPEGMLEILKQQCLLFKKKPLHKAFKEVFISGVGPYKLFQHFDPPEQRQAKRARRQGPRGHHDNTFQPEHCSDPGEDDDADD